MDEEASAAEVEAVRAAFRKAGIDVAVSANLGRKSAPAVSLPWVIYVGIPFTIFITAFAGAAGKAMGERAGTAAWEGLRTLLRDVRAARGDRPDGAIVVKDEDVHEDVVLTPDLPDEALSELLQIEIRKTESSTFMWDRERRVWRDPLDHSKPPPS